MPPTVPPVVDETGAFRELLKAQAASPTNGPKNHEMDPAMVKQREAASLWTNEAYTVRRHIVSLFNFLSMIRRPYLNVTSKGKRTTGSETNDINNANNSQDAFSKWQHNTSLTEAERDEVDFQVKLVVKQCLDRVQELEHGETLRFNALEKALTRAGITSLSPLNLLQNSSLNKQRAASNALHAHHMAITQYLSEQLAHASSVQAMLQQRRVATQRQRYENLADSAKVSSHNSQAGFSEEILRGSIGTMGDRGVDVADELSQEQLHMFEEEASALVESLQADLAAVQHAEQQLQDISALQTRIVQHLQEQNEHIDTLLTEAGSHGEQVTRGNQQLQKAKERNRQANRWLSIFFLISGLVLLFMHCTYTQLTQIWTKCCHRVYSCSSIDVPNFGRLRYISVPYPSKVRKSSAPPKSSAYSLTIGRPFFESMFNTERRISPSPPGYDAVGSGVTAPSTSLCDRLAVEVASSFKFMLSSCLPML